MKNDIRTTFPEIKILQDAPLADYTNTDTGGPADYLAFPKDIEQTKQLVAYAHEQKLPITVLGNASNLIVSDSGIAGLVIILTLMNQITVTQTTITAQAGAAIIDASNAAYQAGLTGLEFACGIPGSVGGAVFMNAGAYGGETKDVFDSATVITKEGQLTTIDAEQMEFGYRHSSLQENGAIVLEAQFKLKTGVKASIGVQMTDLNQRRAAKQPLEWPSCGSVFKRPIGYFAGKLIHDSGLQGYTSGGAQVSTKHAGFIINVGGATASDYVDVIHHVQETVQQKFGVALQTEVRIIGREM
ncbi:UDP-N-acetylmuramate dehydrogenase [Paucilactobacillus sp. N302-9]